MRTIADLGLNMNMAVLTLGSLLYPQDMAKLDFGLAELFNGDSDSRSEYVKQFHDALYKFSLEKVEEMTENSFILVFLESFLDQIDMWEKVQNIMSQFEYSYNKAIELLKKRVTEVLYEGQQIVLPAECKLIQNLAAPTFSETRFISNLTLLQ